MSYYVYMLITSDKNKKVSYVGYTKDLKKESNCIIQEKGQNLHVEESGSLYIKKKLAQKAKQFLGNII